MCPGITVFTSGEDTAMAPGQAIADPAAHPANAHNTVTTNTCNTKHSVMV